MNKMKLFYFLYFSISDLIEVSRILISSFVFNLLPYYVSVAVCEENPAPQRSVLVKKISVLIVYSDN